MTEGSMLLWVQEVVRQEWLNPLVSCYTLLGNSGILWLVLSVLFLLFRPTRRAGVVSLGAMLLGLLCTNVLLKPLVARPRPWLAVEGLWPLVREGDPNSFPSGHTCAAFAAAVSWQKTLPWRWARRTVLGMAVCMGLSRLYVGVHYPSDVLFGAAVGTFCALMAWRLLRVRTQRLSV